MPFPALLLPTVLTSNTRIFFEKDALLTRNELLKPSCARQAIIQSRAIKNYGTAHKGLNYLQNESFI